LGDISAMPIEPGLQIVPPAAPSSANLSSDVLRLMANRH
jgi:hypothetical protein